MTRPREERVPPGGRRHGNTPAAILHPTSAVAKLSPLVMTPYDGPGVRKWRPDPGPIKCAATYASISATCPGSCRFKLHGCFVRSGFTRHMSDLLDDAAITKTGDQVIAEECEHILHWLRWQVRKRGHVPHDGGRYGDQGRDLRLHVGGDVSSRLGARLLADVAWIWRAAGGGRVWTYTHRWRDIERRDWRSFTQAVDTTAISVLASCESADDVRQAERQGYVPALVVSHFPEQHRAFRVWGVPSTRFIPCPAEAGKMTCVQCRLCLDDHQLARRNLGIAFAVHGKDKARIRLPQVGMVGAV